MADPITMAGIVVPAVVTLAQPVVQLLTQKLTSKGGISLADTHEVLNYGLKQLLALQRDKDNEVSSHITQKDPAEVYKLWKECVSNIEKEVASLNKKYDEAVRQKLQFYTRQHIAKEIKRALSNVIKLVEECPPVILVDKLPERVIKENGVPSIEKYQTLQIVFQDIQDLLQSDGIKCVSLHGQKGVGKTTIMQHLNNHFLHRADFDMVIFIKVTADEQTTDLHILQKIAERIHVDGEGNEHELSGRIQRVLKDKRYLLILDGVRHTIDGIWKNLDISKDEKGSKVVIATHYPLASKSACVQRDVELNKLSPDEAWQMFGDIVGAKLLLDIGIPKAQLVCKRFCCCLPLLIDPMARSFKYQESPIDWERALGKWTPQPQAGVGLEELYSKLEICYQMLGDQSKQKCFLYASLYPSNSNIYTDYFVECCIAQGFLGVDDANTKFREMRRRAKDVILRHLVNVAFLEGGEEMRYVKMNDFYRQFAFYILSKDSNSECRTYVDNEEHEEAFRSKSWLHARWVSMVGNKRDSLPTNQKYGSLQTLLLQKNPKLVEIPMTYFDSMVNLLVLNLYGTKIRRLPSLSGLTSLKVFYLNGCSKLIIYPFEIQPLQHLEVFDIRDTSVNFVPCLGSLRCLRISYTASINYHGISKLHKLEELTIEVKSLRQWSDAAENIIQEVASLKNLTTSRWSFPSSDTRGKFLDISKYQEAPIDWERALNEWMPSPQDGVDKTAQLASPREGESSSKSINIISKPASPRAEESSSKSTDVISKLHPGQDLLRLMRIRDLTHLMLSYPMRIGYEDVLEQWINAVCQLSFADDDLDFEDLLSENPLRYVQVLIPKEIISGGSVSKEIALKKVPQPILLLATHLALHQFAHTLTSEKIQNIWFLTRNDAEKQTVVANIQANSQIRAAFDDLRIIDLNQIDDETERELEVLHLETRLEQITSAESRTKDDYYSLAAKNYRRGRHLVLVVDGDGDKKVDPLSVSLPIKRDSEHVVVFITTLSSHDSYFNIVDLTIKTQDHLLPWEVFCNIVGSELLHSSIAIQEIAVQIVEKCGGHLLAIILMAKSLKHVTDIQHWESALEKLRDREAIVNAFFNVIWPNITPEREKVRLLRCLIVIKFLDWKITSDDELFDRWFSEQLVDTKEAAKRIIQNFMECSVLLQFEDTMGGRNIQLPEDIKIILHALGEEIPEDLNEGALVSTISNLQVLSLSHTHMKNLYDINTLPQRKELNLEGCMLKTLPEAIFKLQKLETLSLERCSQLLKLSPQIAKLDNLKELRLAGCKRLKTRPQEFWELPNLEVCDISGTQITYLPQFSNNLSKLRSLLLGNNLNLMKIPSSYFYHVPLLNILDLTCTSIHELPSSIFNLHELRKLYLKDCELFAGLTPAIGRLNNLTTLDLGGTLITHLPKEIEELTSLESLSLSFYNDSNLALIPCGVLSKLTHLKVLRIGVNSDNEWWSKNVKNILADINELKMLRALDMYIPIVNFSNPIEKCLSNFRFIIGHHKPRMISRVRPAIEVMFKESGRSLKFVYGKDFPHEVKSILSEAWAFFLDRHMKINNLTQFGLKNLKKLRLCILAECNEMQSIVEADKKSLCMQFLTIFYMKNLRSIINKPFHGNTIFCKLELLALHTCPKLTTIFTMHSLHSLVNLQELIVEDCPKVSSIISCSSSERTTDFFFPRLRKLSLLFVPELSSISNGMRIGRNLEQMGLYNCPKLHSFSTAELSSEQLKVIRGERKWWEELQWSEVEWGQRDSPDKFSKIFSAIDDDHGILTQLTTYELMTSFSTRNDSEYPGWKLKS